MKTQHRECSNSGKDAMRIQWQRLRGEFAVAVKRTQQGHSGEDVVVSFAITVARTV